MRKGFNLAQEFFVHQHDRRNVIWKRPGYTQQSFILRGFPPRFNPSPFYIHFWQQRCPFRIPSINNWNGTPFTCSLELCIPFNCCKGTVWIWMNHKTTTFSRPFHSHASVSSCGVLGLFTDQNDRFPYPFIYLEPKIGTFFGRSHPVQGSTPPGEKQSIAFIKGSGKGFWSLWGVKMWASLGPFLNSQENVLEETFGARGVSRSRFS